MKDIATVTLKDMTSFFRNRSERWTNKTRMETKRKAIRAIRDKVALISTRDYNEGVYFIGIVKSFYDNEKFYFDQAHGQRGQWIYYKDVQELIVENR